MGAGELEQIAQDFKRVAELVGRGYDLRDIQVDASDLAIGQLDVVLIFQYPGGRREIVQMNFAEWRQ